MKKLHLMVVILVLLVFPVFAQTAEQEEIAYLLFLPNSSNSFANRAEATRQLDSLAENLKARDLVPGQIHVYGYSAVAANDIEPVRFSRQRAVHVINELQRRGVSSDLFSEPKGFGEVNLWGSNTTQANRSPNRRVRILLDIVPAAEETPLASATPAQPETPAQPVTPLAAVPVQDHVITAGNANLPLTPVNAGTKIPWMYLLLLLLLILAVILLILFFLSKRRKKSSDETTGPSAAVLQPEPFVAAAPAVADDNTNNDVNIIRSKYMEMENAIREIISAVPAGNYFDLHTIVSRLLQTHDEIYFAHIGNYTNAAQYHSKISSIVANMSDVVELVGKSYSRNIHFNFSECNLFRKKK